MSEEPIEIKKREGPGEYMGNLQEDDEGEMGEKGRGRGVLFKYSFQEGANAQR